MQVDFHLTLIVDTKLQQDVKIGLVVVKQVVGYSSGCSASRSQFLQYPRVTGQICKVICLLFGWDHEGMLVSI